MSFLSRYTMPIYLMHTMCAAGVRSLLIKLGTVDSAVHVTLGLLISFAGPIVAAELMKWLRLDFLLYPIKYMKLSKHSEVKADA